jgi:predicted RND superfamily exporter protein
LESISTGERALYHLTRLSLAYPRVTLLLLAVITASLAAGLPQLRTEFGYRVLIGDDHPSVRALDELIARFGGGLPLVIAWECGDGWPCESAFGRNSVEMAHAVTRALAPVPGIRDILGIANAAVLVPDGGGFAIRRLVENGKRVSDAEALAARALDDPLWVGRLVSADGSVGVIAVQPSDSRNETAERMLNAVEGALAPHRQRGFEFHLAGTAATTVTAGRDLAESTARLIPLTVLIIGSVLLGLSRSWQVAAIALATMGLALAWTFGLLGWLDWPQDGILEVLAPLILVVGVCDAVHLLARYGVEVGSQEDVRGSEARSRALLLAAREVGPPCLITTLTTSVAFLSFVTSGLDTFVRFGAIAAFGVAACLILTFTLMPILTRAIPIGEVRTGRASDTWGRALDAIVRSGEKHAVPILVGATLLFAVLGFGWIGYLRLDNDWLESFGKRSRAVQQIRFVERHLGSSETLEIEIALPPEAALEDPVTLAAVSDFSKFLSTVDGSNSATSVLTLLERLNRVIHGDDPAFERYAESAAANAEILELLTFDDASVLAPWTSLDRSRLRISVEVPLQAHSKRKAVLVAVRDYVESALPVSWRVLLSGGLAINFDWVNEVQRTQLRSFPTALLLVFLMVARFLGSVRLSLAAMLSTLLPVVAVLGTMGWCGMSLDVGRAMIATVLLGIGVDDSIHLLDHYKRCRAAGRAPREAIREALLHTGRAVVTTSLALSIGFLTLMGSAWHTISSFGFSVSLGILAALLATLFVLPALIFAFGHWASLGRKV